MRQPFTPSFRLLLAVAALGCGGGDGTAGMSGRQIVRGHDVSDLFFANADTVGFTRQAAEPSDSGPQDLWIYGLADAEPQLALPNIDWAPPVWWANVRVGTSLETGPYGRLFYDFSTRQRTDLTNFSGAATGGEGGPTAIDAGVSVGLDGGPSGGRLFGDPWPSDDAIAVRRDGAAVALTGLDPQVVGVGPPASLQTFRLPATPAALDFIGSDLLILGDPSSGTEPPLLGLYRLAVATHEWTELVPPTPATQWAVTLAGCNGFGPDRCDQLEVVGCGATDLACGDTGVVPCAIVYAKDDPANPGQTAMYAYDLNTAADIILPGQGARHLYVSPDQHLVVWDDSQIDSKRYWDLCTGKKDFCPNLVGPHLLWRPDSQGMATLTDQGQLTVADFRDNLCAVSSVGGVAYAALYAPSSDRIAWLAPDDGNGTPAGLWMANRDGTEPVMVDAGSFSGARFSPDETKMLVSRSASSSVSLAWIDVTASPAVEHHLVDNYGGFSRMGNRRVLLVDGWNTQDASGTLVLLDMVTGARTVLGRAATAFALSGSVDDGGSNLAYVARSRVSSDRDGLWLTTLPP